MPAPDPTETTKPPAKPEHRATDLSADGAAVNMLVRRTGCTIREATCQLEGKPGDAQRKIAAHAKAEPEHARKAELAEALAQLKAAGIDAADPCPFGAPKRGPCPTWGDVVARLVCSGQAGDVATIIARAKARGAA